MASEIERYDLMTTAVKDRRGTWVRYEDHAAEVAALRARVEELEQAETMLAERCARLLDERDRMRPVYEAAMATPSWRLHDRLADEVERARRDAGVCPDCGKAGCGEALYAREAEDDAK